MRLMASAALFFAVLMVVGVFMERGLGQAGLIVAMFSMGTLVGQVFRPWRGR